MILSLLLLIFKSYRKKSISAKCSKTHFHNTLDNPSDDTFQIDSLGRKELLGSSETKQLLKGFVRLEDVPSFVRGVLRLSRQTIEANELRKRINTCTLGRKNL